MADKLRTTFAVPVTFTEGDVPSSSKFNGLARQARNGLSLVEYAIGDIWNSAGDSLLGDSTEAPLMIPNVARFIGQSKLLNPTLLDLWRLAGSGTRYYWSLSSFAGKREARLPFAPSSASYTWTGTGAPSSLKVSPGLVQATGDYCVSGQNLYTYDAIGSDWEVYYRAYLSSDAGYGTGKRPTHNIIPDPDTLSTYDFRGLKIVYKNGADNADGYLIYFPPRGPIEDGTARDINISPQDIANNYSNTPWSNFRVWQQDTVVAPTTANAGNHYRYTLPEVLTSSSTWATGATIPTGFMYLWDTNDTATIIDGVTFTVQDSTMYFVVVATGAGLDNWLATTQGQTAYPTGTNCGVCGLDHFKNALNGGAGDDHSAHHYPSTGLSLITVGNSIANAVSELRKQFLNHNHSDANILYGTGIPSAPTAARVKHSELEGLMTTWGTPMLSRANKADDAHPQYLERHGYAADRDKYKNMMLGDLLLSSTTSTTDYENSSASSNKLRFGVSTASGANMYWSYSDAALVIDPGTISPVAQRRLLLSQGSYQVATQNQNIAVPLVLTGVTGGLDQYTYDGDGNATESVLWRRKVLVGDKIVYQWGNSGSGSLAPIYFTITDWPQGMVLSSVTIYYRTDSYGPGTEVLDVHLYKRKGWGLNSVSSTAQLPGTSNWDLYWAVATTDANRWDRRTDILEIKCWVPDAANSDFISILPYATLSVSFNAVSPYQVL
jgi:hypothetical protein